jgi:fructose-bisphosphate aldolase class II
MIDASHLSYEDNIALTKKVVEYAHSKNVTVEAELGVLAGVEEDVSANTHVYTDPQQAVDFITRTGCDSLAIAIGTSHGIYKFKGEAKLRLDILEELSKLMPNYPFVLHGASSIPQQYVELANNYGATLSGAKGVPEEMLKQACSMNICKVNVDSDLRIGFTAGVREYLSNNPQDVDMRSYLKAGKSNVKDIVKFKIQNIFNSQNKA